MQKRKFSSSSRPGPALAVLAVLLAHSMAWAFDVDICFVRTSIDDKIAKEYETDALKGLPASDAIDFIVGDRGMPQARYDAFFLAIDWEKTVKHHLLASGIIKVLYGGDPHGTGLKNQFLRSFAEAVIPAGIE